MGEQMLIAGKEDVTKKSREKSGTEYNSARNLNDFSPQVFFQAVLVAHLES